MSPRAARRTRDSLIGSGAGGRVATTGRHSAAARGDVQAIPSLGDAAGADRPHAALLGHHEPAAEPHRHRQDDGVSASAALVSVLKEHVGGRRRPLLALDAAESAAAGEHLTARGAAIRGVGNFASETVFGLKLLPSGELEPDWDAIDGFFARHGAEETLVFGFTFIVWTRFLLEAERREKRFRVAARHAASLRRLEEVDRRGGDQGGVPPPRRRDAHGRSAANSRFLRHGRAGGNGVGRLRGRQQARPRLRRRVDSPPAHARAGRGRRDRRHRGSRALPTSYPGQALLTEDQGLLAGVDDCPCGRKGISFRFAGRIEQAEVRGCGDVFAQAREIR